MYATFIDIIVDPTFFAPAVSEFWETYLMVDVDCHHNDRNHLEKKKNRVKHIKVVGSIV
jgi:prephenate dehydratase